METVGIPDEVTLAGVHYLGQSLGFAQVPEVYLGHCPRYSPTQDPIFSPGNEAFFWPVNASIVSKLTIEELRERASALYSSFHTSSSTL